MRSAPARMELGQMAALLTRRNSGQLAVRFLLANGTERLVMRRRLMVRSVENRLRLAGQ